MKINDKNTIMSIYDSLTTNKIQEIDYLHFKYSRKLYEVDMNIEEIILWQKLREIINKKQDIEIKFGYKG